MKKELQGFLWITGVYVFVRLLSLVGGRAFALGDELSYLFGFAITTMVLTFICNFKEKLALIFLCLLALHEFGHVLGGWLVGAETKGFAFYGLFGGADIAETFERWKDFIIGFSGPFLGNIAALLVLKIERLKRKPAWLPPGLDIIAWFAIIINLFNLMPVYPLDGGRIILAIGTSIHSGFLAYTRVLAFVTLGLLSIIFWRHFSRISAIFIIGFTLISFRTWGVVPLEDQIGAAIGPLALGLSIFAYIVLVAFSFDMSKKLAPEIIKKSGETK